MAGIVYLKYASVLGLVPVMLIESIVRIVAVLAVVAVVAEYYP
jgi:hypothetical protein